MTTTDIPELNQNQKTEIEAALFRKMMDHLQKYPEVQNIDLMNLAYFCRNCFSKWYMSAASEHGVELNYDQAREIIYGMPFPQYKSKYQAKASDTQLSIFENAQKKATE
jgi:hypothetical protein